MASGKGKDGEKKASEKAPKRGGPLADRTVKKRAFVEAYKECGSIFHACKAAQISRDTYYRWIRNDRAFARRVAQAYEVSGEQLEYSAYARARGYPAKYDSKGKLIRAESRGDTTLTIFLLKGRYPDKYADRFKGEVKDPTTFAAWLAANNNLNAKRNNESEIKDDTRAIPPKGLGESKASDQGDTRH